MLSTQTLPRKAAPLDLMPRQIAQPLAPHGKDHSRRAVPQSLHCVHVAVGLGQTAGDAFLKASAEARVVAQKLPAGRPAMIVFLVPPLMPDGLVASLGAFVTHANRLFAQRGLRFAMQNRIGAAPQGGKGRESFFDRLRNQHPKADVDTPSANSA